MPRCSWSLFQSRNRESSYFNAVAYNRLCRRYYGFQSRNRESSYFNTQNNNGDVKYGVFQSRNRESSYFNPEVCQSASQFE